MTPLSDMDRRGYLAHTRLPVFRNRVDGALKAIAEVFDHCAAAESKSFAGCSDNRRPYVAFSAGKDSSVLQWLTLSLYPNAVARTLTSGETRLLHRNFNEVIAWWKNTFPGLTHEEILIDRVFSPGCESLSWHEQRKLGRGDIREYMPDPRRFNGVLLGLRDEESNARRITNRRGAVRKYSTDRTDDLAGTVVCCPLARWTTTDIGAATVLYDLPMLDAYQHEGMDARTTARLTGDSVRHGSLVQLRQRDPGSYNALLVRFPELAWWSG